MAVQLEYSKPLTGYARTRTRRLPRQGINYELTAPGVVPIPPVSVPATKLAQLQAALGAAAQGTARISQSLEYHAQRMQNLYRGAGFQRYRELAPSLLEKIQEKQLLVPEGMSAADYAKQLAMEYADGMPGPMAQTFVTSMTATLTPAFIRQREQLRQEQAAELLQTYSSSVQTAKTPEDIIAVVDEARKALPWLSPLEVMRRTLLTAAEAAAESGNIELLHMIKEAANGKFIADFAALEHRAVTRQQQQITKQHKAIQDNLTQLEQQGAPLEIYRQQIQQHVDDGFITEAEATSRIDNYVINKMRDMAREGNLNAVVELQKHLSKNPEVQEEAKYLQRVASDRVRALRVRAILQRYYEGTLSGERAIKTATDLLKAYDFENPDNGMGITVEQYRYIVGAVGKQVEANVAEKQISDMISGKAPPRVLPDTASNRTLVENHLKRFADPQTGEIPSDIEAIVLTSTGIIPRNRLAYHLNNIKYGTPSEALQSARLLATITKAQPALEIRALDSASDKDGTILQAIFLARDDGTLQNDTKMQQLIEQLRSMQFIEGIDITGITAVGSGTPFKTEGDAKAFVLDEIRSKLEKKHERIFGSGWFTRDPTFRATADLYDTAMKIYGNRIRILINAGVDEKTAVNKAIEYTTAMLEHKFLFVPWKTKDGDKTVVPVRIKGNINTPDYPHANEIYSIITREPYWLQKTAISQFEKIVGKNAEKEGIIGLKLVAYKPTLEQLQQYYFQRLKDDARARGLPFNEEEARETAQVLAKETADKRVLSGFAYVTENGTLWVDENGNMPVFIPEEEDLRRARENLPLELPLGQLPTEEEKQRILREHGSVLARTDTQITPPEAPANVVDVNVLWP